MDAIKKSPEKIKEAPLPQPGKQPSKLKEVPTGDKKPVPIKSIN